MCGGDCVCHALPRLPVSAKFGIRGDGKSLRRPSVVVRGPTARVALRQTDSSGMLRLSLGTVRCWFTVEEGDEHGCCRRLNASSGGMYPRSCHSPTERASGRNPRPQRASRAVERGKRQNIARTLPLPRSLTYGIDALGNVGQNGLLRDRSATKPRFLHRGTYAAH